MYWILWRDDECCCFIVGWLDCVEFGVVCVFVWWVCCVCCLWLYWCVGVCVCVVVCCCIGVGYL